MEEWEEIEKEEGSATPLSVEKASLSEKEHRQIMEEMQEYRKRCLEYELKLQEIEREKIGESKEESIPPLQYSGKQMDKDTEAMILINSKLRREVSGC